MKSKAVRRVASLPLQIVLYFSGWYLALYSFAILGLMIYKGKSEKSRTKTIRVQLPFLVSSYHSTVSGKKFLARIDITVADNGK